VPDDGGEESGFELDEPADDKSAIAHDGGAGESRYLMCRMPEARSDDAPLS
jgi:hypothetical protein